MFYVRIEKDGAHGFVELVAYKRGDVHDVVLWMQDQVKLLKKEQHLMPRADKGEPLGGL